MTILEASLTYNISPSRICQCQSLGGVWKECTSGRLHLKEQPKKRPVLEKSQSVECLNLGEMCICLQQIPGRREHRKLGVTTQ